MMKIQLKNPHSALAALKMRPKDVQQVILGGVPHGAWAEVEKLAREQRVPVQGTDSRPKKDFRPGKPIERGEKTGRESVMEVWVKAKEPVSLSELFSSAKEGEGGLWLALDCVQDPRNVGAIFRTASFFGVKGILLTEDRSADLAGIAYDVAAGGIEYLPYAVETNLRRSLDAAKEADVWILGTSERAKAPLKSVKRDRNWLVVLGNEESGMRQLTEQTCDVICRAPAFSDGVQSLNVSVAAGVVLAHLTS